MHNQSLLATATALALLLCTACDAQPELEVELTTDYVAGVEFDAYRVTVLDWQARPVAGPPLLLDPVFSMAPERVTLEEARRFHAGASIAIRPVPPGDYLIVVELFEFNRVAASNLLFARHSAENRRHAITISVDCAGLACPDAGAGAGFTACIAGVCVDPRCDLDEPEALDPESGERLCGELRVCGADAECEVDAMCAAPVCLAGFCSVVPDPEACAADEYCHPREGCIPPPPPGIRDRCGLSCDPGDPCLSGEVVCSGGTARCVVQGPTPRGYECEGGFCDGDGACQACEAGAMCLVGCGAGTQECDGAEPRCVPGDDLAEPGTSCTDLEGEPGLCHVTGDCTACVIACDPVRDTDGDGTPDVHDVEQCNGDDDDGDGQVDESGDEQSTFYLDEDRDSWGDDAHTAQACLRPIGFVARGGDCDDLRFEVKPGAAETCDGVDEDCDGAIDEDAGERRAFYLDGDGDGQGGGAPVLACARPAGAVDEGGDCDDADPAVNSGAAEVCDGVDNDCDGAFDEAGGATPYYPDSDGDGFGAASPAMVGPCAPPAGFVADSSDCDDGRAAVYPMAPEVCDDLDNDCDLRTDESPTDGEMLFDDLDGDGYGAPGSEGLRCPGQTASVGGDCDDGAPLIHPDALERCNGVNEDCDGATDESPIDGQLLYRDGDGDGFGDSDAIAIRCPGPGFVAAGGDCDDDEMLSYPGADERCDGIDNNCNSTPDSAEPFSAFGGATGGDGSPANPYLICTADDLERMRAEPTRSYRLVRSVDFEEEGVASFTPIDYFAGDFDGAGRGLLNLAIQEPASSEDTAFFRRLDGAHVHDVNLLTRGAVVGGAGVAVVASRVAGGRIEDVFVQGDVRGQDSVALVIGSASATVLERLGGAGTVFAGGDHPAIGPGRVYTAGGLVASLADTSLRDASADVTVEMLHSLGGPDFGAAGGMVGALVDSTLERGTTLAGSAVVSADSAGGLVGRCSGTSHISHSSSWASTQSVEAAGGLVGFSACLVTDSFARGDVSAAKVCGGAIGYAECGLVNGTEQHTVARVWATGRVTTAGIAGGLIGRTRLEAGAGQIQLTDLYASGSVTGQFAAGLIGSNGCDVHRAYALPASATGSLAAAVIGRLETGGRCVDCFYLDDPAYPGLPRDNYARALRLLEMESSATYPSFTFGGDGWFMPSENALSPHSPAVLAPVLATACDVPGVTCGP